MWVDYTDFEVDYTDFENFDFVVKILWGRGGGTSSPPHPLPGVFGGGGGFPSLSLPLPPPPQKKEGKRGEKGGREEGKRVSTGLNVFRQV